MIEKTAIPLCPDCNGKSVIIGKIPATIYFAGRILEHPLSGGSLYRCSECELGFRWPRLSKKKLDLLYTNGESDTWSYNTKIRRDWRVAYKWIKENIPCGSSILDVGCFDGAFLSPISHFYQCFGIEIHPYARAQAESKGINIVGMDFSDLMGKFDCITAFDIIEHVESPRRFLEQAVSCLNSGGRFIVSTGNLDSFMFRLMGSRYYYCTIAEHISFISPGWAEKQVVKLGMKIEYISFFTHTDFSSLSLVKHTTTNLIYRFFPGFVRYLRMKGLGGIDAMRYPELSDHPPSMPGSKDHFLIIFRKP